MKSFFVRLPRWAQVYYVSLAAILGTTAMHIPDGYLSPATCVILFLLVLPFWVVGLRRLRDTMSARSIPLIALMAAFSFVIMMFNVPLPGGTTGHAVGAALAAILLGPEVATVAVSVALLIQALLFGDGGILTLGANCFNMAVVLPYVSYGLYQAIGRSAPPAARRRLVAAAVGAYVGLGAAALCAGVEFGIQPALARAADGTPLYAPYPLAVAVPAMVLPHLAVASVVEAIVTVMVLAYLQRTNVALLQVALQRTPAGSSGAAQSTRGLWLLLAALVIASPLGLLAPGTAWGEWGARELARMGLGFVPKGLSRLEALWGAPMAGYGLPAVPHAGLSYALAAGVGVVVVVLIVWLFGMLLTGHRRTEDSR